MTAGSASHTTHGSWPPPRSVWYDRTKRLLDVCVAVTVLTVGLPLWLVIAAVVKMTSSGPVLYRAAVVGRDGVQFTYFKFRSMRGRDATVHHEWLAAYVTGDEPSTPDGATPPYKAVEAGRVTAVGRALRKFSLDEIPQLLNVIRGDMSVVGPRPPLVAEYVLYNEETRRRLAVLPGITGLAQVSARGRASFSRMVDLDCDYIRRQSSRLDLSIMIRTFWVVLTTRGAL
jgi:lipopolysaccharide/colanic/teichoic acid biosynthesis glycosyltransferase